MNATTLKQWAMQITTGIGAILSSGAAIAILTHQVTWQQGYPALVAAAVAFFWPENPKAQAEATNLFTAVEPLIPVLLSAYKTGIQHGASAQSAVPVPVSHNPNPMRDANVTKVTS
jgi:hypothetical protein